MLILTRRVDESVIIGENIHIKVLGIRGNQVRIGITAPSEVRVFREEIMPGRRKVANDEKGEPTS